MAWEGEILALDVASNCGVAEGRPGEVPRIYSVKFARPDDQLEDIFGRAVFWIAERLQVSRPELVVIEAPPPAGAMHGNTNANAVATTLGLWAVLSGCCRCKGIRVRSANIARVRKHFIDQGHLPGQEAKRRVMRMCRALGWEAPNHDAADAAAVWSWAVTQVAPGSAPNTKPLFSGIVA